jgi:PAS domain S-box-containing protein
MQNIVGQVHLGSHVDPTLLSFRATGLAIAVGVTYFFAAELGLALLAKPDGVAVFWPAAGVSSGVLIALGRDARLPVASGVTVATVIANLLGDRNVWSAAAFAFCNAGEATVAAWLIERHFGLRFHIDSVRNVAGLLAAAAVAAAASGIGATVAYKLFHSPTASIWTIWQHWFASDAIGIIAVAPFVLGIGEALRDPPPRREVIEGVVALAALVVMALVIVSLPESWTVRPVALLFPIILWLAARCQPVFAAASAFIVSLMIICKIIFGIDHFRIPAFPIGDRILGAQAAILSLALLAYVLEALFAERRQHETRLQEALAAAAVAAFDWDPRSGRLRRSKSAAQVLGFDPRQTLTAGQFLAQIHPDDRAHFKALVNGVSAGSPCYSATFRFIRADEREVWLAELSRAEFDTTGRFMRLKGVTRDITGRKQAEERQDLLIAELDHRVKNVLARVAAIAMHTRRHSETPDEFIKVFDGRIQSMAAAHALLSQGRWSGVGLTDLIRRQLEPYATDANTTISGPQVMLTPAQTQAVALVIHELATNAAKYGALSGPDGSVSVAWGRTGADAARLLTIVWRELGGPPIVTPIRSGYGSRLIRDLIPHELGGAVDLTFPSGGACCKIEIPLERT